MEKGTSTSRRSLTAHLDRITQRIKETHGVNIWFAEIKGRRWSYIAGRKEEEPSMHPSRRIKLAGRLGIVSDGWEKITAEEGELIISSLREAIKAYE